MDAEKLLDKLLLTYESNYDIRKYFQINNHMYDAFAQFSVTSSKYVLMKKAELWKADCFEYVLFKCVKTLTSEDLDLFMKDLVTYLEPIYVRSGAPCPNPNHMYSFMTGIFICENTPSQELMRKFKKMSYTKNYRMGIRGYSQMRLLAIDLAAQCITGNRAAKALVNGYAKAGLL